jgi:Flp pilus assembly protein TadD
MDVQAWFELGNQWFLAGRRADALACYQQAVALRPSHAEAWYNLGVVLSIENRVDEALRAYDAAIAQRPGYVDALNNAGILHHAKGNWSDAALYYETAMRAAPASWDPIYNYGQLLQAQDRWDDALHAYNRVVQIQPRHADAWNNRGNVLLELGHPAAAQQSFERALECLPRHTEARWNLGVVQLLQGNFHDGWPNYEARLDQPEAVRRSFPSPRWRGEDLAGKTILLHAEQGLGDTIQFARFAPQLAQRGGNVILECQPPLHDLLSCLAGVTVCVPEAAPRRDLDFHLELMSAPSILRLQPPQFSPAPGYLRAAPERLDYWRHRLEPAGPDLRVGIAWSGNPRNRRDRIRSLPSPLLEPLTSLAGTAWYSLQRPTSDDPPRVQTWGPEPPDFSSTAALMLHLDLVIAVDTAALHLAGALGRPVWGLLPYVPDFRWLLDGDTSPWYPTLRLFRQPRLRDWESVIADVRAALTDLIHARRRAK